MVSSYRLYCILVVLPSTDHRKESTAFNSTIQSRLLTTLKKKALENTVGKEENAGNQHFLLFPTVFSSLPQREIVILATFNLWSANAFNFVMSKNLSFGKGFTDFFFSYYFFFLCLAFSKRNRILSRECLSLLHLINMVISLIVQLAV